jgi:acyl-CoA thioester hydrolase
MLGHVNNVEYYRYFEIIVLTSLARAGLDWRQDSIIPFTVENHCCFRRPLMPVDTLDGCFRIARISRSSATYELGLFMPNDEIASAYGYFIHVFVDRHTERSAEIPEGIRAAFDAHRIRLDRRDPEYVGESALFPAAVPVP